MKRSQSVLWPVALLLVYGALLAALSGCESSKGAMGHHGHCPMCNTFGGHGHGYGAGDCPEHGSGCYLHECWARHQDPADCIADYHRQQTSRTGWRAKNVRTSIY